MTPVQIIEKLLAVNPGVAKFILAGMGFFAAAAIVVSFNLDTNTAVIVIVYILVLGTVGTLLAFISGNSALMTVLGWGVVVVMLALLITFSYAAVVRDPTPIKPTPCLVRFWSDCQGVLDSVANRVESPIPVKDIPANPPEVAVDRKSYRVFVQFAGYRRDDVISAAKALKDAGWNVQGAAAGGERLDAAAGLAQVRYKSQAEKSAAELLAKEIGQTGLKSSVQATQMSAIAAKTLEVWIGL